MVTDVAVNPLGGEDVDVHLKVVLDQEVADIRWGPLRQR
jgi:hypothetical protein